MTRSRKFLDPANKTLDDDEIRGEGRAMSNKPVPEAYFHEVHCTHSIIMTRSRVITVLVAGCAMLYIAGSSLFGYLEVAIGADPIRDQRAEQSSQILAFGLAALLLVSLHRILRGSTDA